jgi:RHS repeat-associated protein
MRFDANGNALIRNGLSVTWTSFNHQSLINGKSLYNGSSESVSFAYDQNHERWKAVLTSSAGTETTYLIGGLLEKVITAGAIDFRHFITAGGARIAVYSRTTASVNTLRYIREDHLGSTASLLNSDGTSYVEESFTAFGLRRSSCTWTGNPTSGNLTKANSATRHGYTWHTALGSMGLNDMNGRIQDAVTGRFLSADPYIPDPELTQDYNRYSYVRNNPLTFTDPTGFIPADLPEEEKLEEVVVTAKELPNMMAQLTAEAIAWLNAKLVFTTTVISRGGTSSSQQARQKEKQKEKQKKEREKQRQKSFWDKAKNWLCERGNDLASASGNLSEISGPLEAIGVVAAPFTEGATLPLAAAGGSGNEIAGYAQMAAGLFQGIDTGSYSNLTSAAIAMGTGMVLTRGIIPGSSGRAAQQATDRFLNSSRIVTGGVYDSLITIADDLAPHQVQCSGAGQ